MKLDTTLEEQGNLTLLRKLTGCSDIVATTVFAAFGGDVVEVVSAPDDMLRKFGLSPEQVTKLRAGVELTRRYLSAYGSRNMKRVTSAEDAIDYVTAKMGPMVCDATQERFWCITMDIRNKVTNIHEIALGTVSAAVINVSGIARYAIADSASRVVLVHNHPSGECDPSKEDIDLTNRVSQALKYLDIRILDHIIIGKKSSDYFSFARSGMI